MKKIINLSEASLIALHSMVVIAGESTKQISVKKIAKRINASENHIAKIMQRLVKEGFISSHRGPLGGFYLSMKPENITLLDIYQAIEGKQSIYGCSFNKSKCIFSDCISNCIFEKVTGDATSLFINYMKNKTLLEYIKN